MSEKDTTYQFSDEAIRQSGRIAQKNNITAAKIVAETIRTTLGPKGMDKMLVDSSGEVTVTNDGVTILREMEIEHPAAKMIVEVAKTQEDEVGDGTTTAVVFAGELLKQAERLLEKNVHPTSIVKGYRKAAEKSQEALLQLAKPISFTNTDLIQQIALTAMTGKGAESAKETLSSLVCEAVKTVLKEGKVDRKSIKLEKKIGESIDQSELIKGIVIDKEKTHSAMPTKVKQAKILLLNTPLEVRDTEIDAKISITTPSQMQEFLTMEETMIQDLITKIKQTGANVVFCQKGIDDLAQFYLAKSNILAARRVKQSDMESLAKATGGSIVNNLDGITLEDLGKGTVEEVIVGEDAMIYVKDCPNPQIVTILVRGSTEHVVAEAKRALEDAIGDVSAALKNGKVVPGAGAIEIELGKVLRTYAQGLFGKEQLAVQAFADALDIIPQTLAENAGLDPIDIVTSLKASHDKGNKSFGIDVFTGRVVDSWAEGVVEPLKIKTQAISSATEVAVMILRIDDVIASKRKEENP